LILPTRRGVLVVAMPPAPPSSAGFSVEETAILVSGAVLLTANLVIGGRWCAWHCTSQLKQLREEARSVGRSLCRRRTTQVEKDATQELVAECVSAKVASNTAKLCWWFRLMAAATSAILCANLLMRSPRWLSRGQTWLSILNLAVQTMFTSVCPQFVLRRPTVPYLWIMLHLSAYLWTSPGDLALTVMAEGCIFCFRCIAGVRHCRTRTVVLCNLLYLVAGLFKSVRDFPGTAKPLVVLQLWTTSIVVLWSAVSSAACWEDARQSRMSPCVARPPGFGICWRSCATSSCPWMES